MFDFGRNVRETLRYCYDCSKFISLINNFFMANYPNNATIDRQVLDNGIILLTYQNPYAKTIVLEGGIWTGAANETRQNAGISNMAASTLMRGTETRSFEEIYDQLESVGASLSYGSGYEITEFSAESLPEDFDHLLDLISDTLRNPTFPAEQVEQIRAEVLTRIAMRQNDTRSMASLNFRAALYPNHPYGRSVTGYVDTVPAITRDDLLAFHAATYAPNEMILTVVSAFSADEIRSKIEAALGDWSNSTYERSAGIAGVARPSGIERINFPMADKTQADIVLGLPGPLRSAPDYMAAKVANTVLGVFGMMGRLGKNVREKQGLAYYARSVLQGSIGPAPWYVSTGVAPENVDKAIASIQDEVRRIQTELVPATELADTKAYLTGSLPLSLETTGGQANIIYTMEMFGLDRDYLMTYGDVINGISAERLQSAAQKYFSADDIVISVAGA